MSKGTGRDKSLDKALDKSGDKSGDKSPSKSPSKSGDKSPSKSGDKSGSKSLDKALEKATSRTSIKSIGEDMRMKIIEVAFKNPEEIENKTIEEYIRLKENIGRVDKGFISAVDPSTGWTVAATARSAAPGSHRR